MLYHNFACCRVSYGIIIWETGADKYLKAVVGFKGFARVRANAFLECRDNQRTRSCILLWTLDQWFLAFISLPNPYVILLWFEKIFLIFHSLGPFFILCRPFFFCLCPFSLVHSTCFLFVIDLRPFFLVFDIFLSLFELTWHVL